MPGFHRGMGGKNAFRPGQGLGLLKIETCREFFSHQFKREECGVTFIHVEGRGLHSESPEQTDATDPQQDFLHDPGGRIAPIDAVGQVAQWGVVFWQISIQQIDRASTDIDTPSLETDLMPRNIDPRHDPVSNRIDQGFQRQVGRVQ